MAKIQVSSEVFADIEALTRAPSAVARQQGPAPGNCTLVIIFGPDGKPGSMNCGGRCGTWDRFLGRSCQKITPGSSEGVHVSCTCQGGWWDSIFSRS